MSAQPTNVNKPRKNKTADLWHVRLGRVSYHKLKVTMKKSRVKDLPDLEVREDIVVLVVSMEKHINFRARNEVYC